MVSLEAEILESRDFYSKWLNEELNTTADNWNSPTHPAGPWTLAHYLLSLSPHGISNICCRDCHVLQGTSSFLTSDPSCQQHHHHDKNVSRVWQMSQGGQNCLLRSPGLGVWEQRAAVPQQSLGMPLGSLKGACAFLVQNHFSKGDTGVTASLHMQQACFPTHLLSYFRALKCSRYIFQVSLKFR